MRDEFFIYDKNRIRVGMLQNYDSVQWLEYYQDYGEVKIVAAATEENLALLVVGNRIYNTGSTTAAKIVETEITEQAGETPQLIVRAWLTAKLLDERVVIKAPTEKNAEQAIYSAYTANREGLPIGTMSVKGYTEEREVQVGLGSVLEAVRNIAQNAGLGFTVDFAPLNGTEMLRVYKGADRTSPGTSSYVGYLGLDAGNISDMHIVHSEAGYKNAAVIAGEGEGGNRYIRKITLGSFTGEDLRVLYVDAANISWEYTVSVETGELDETGQPKYSNEKREYTVAEYNALLEAEGLAQLADWVKEHSVTCNAAQWNLVFGTDYMLGDRLPVKIEKYGIPASARVTGVKRIYDAGGETTEAILSDFEMEVRA